VAVMCKMFEKWQHQCVNEVANRNETYELITKRQFIMDWMRVNVCRLHNLWIQRLNCGKIHVSLLLLMVAISVPESHLKATCHAVFDLSFG
jgi:hypothetical protein